MRILNFGSLNFDKVYDVAHFASGGETILSRGYGEFLGGKGLNQSVALARAGAEVYHAGAIGADGDALRSVLEKSGVDTRYLRQVDTVSGHAIIQRSEGQNCIIVCGGANQCVTREQIRDTLADFGPEDWLLLQNEISNVPFAIEEAKRMGMKVAFNASPITDELLSYPLDQVDCFIINEVEGKALAQMEGEDDLQILDALSVRFPDAIIVLTVGEKGVLYREGDMRLSHNSYPVHVVDTTAAGDTFCGYFLAGVSRKLSQEKILEMASKASAIAVSRYGAEPSIPRWNEVMDFHPGEALCIQK